MIEEATKNARTAADKFAKDSGSKLGGIQRASQGQFTISDRDPNTPYIKQVRVVTTIDYSLEDGRGNPRHIKSQWPIPKRERAIGFLCQEKGGSASALPQDAEHVGRRLG